LAKQKKQKRRGPQTAVTDLPPTQAAFLACGRCGYFLTGYKALQKDLDRAIANQTDQTLALTWDKGVRDLLAKVYGIDLDRGDDYYSGRCSECWRPFSFEQEMGENGLTGRLQIKA
jgi:hypothetical protein